MMTPELMHHELLTALTRYDAREAAKAARRKNGYHNPWAIAHYCAALQHWDKLIAAGRTPRAALMGCFCGRLLDVCLKAIGEPKAEPAESAGSASWVREEI